MTKASLTPSGRAFDVHVFFEFVRRMLSVMSSSIIVMFTLCLCAYFTEDKYTSHSWQYQTLIASIVVFIGLIAVAVLVDAQKSDATQGISGTFILYALFSLFALIILISIVYITAYNANLLYNTLQSALGVPR